MKTVVAMTIYDRTPQVNKAVFAGLSLPGNQTDIVAVCYDRAPEDSNRAFQEECTKLGVELRESKLEDEYVGPRCPSRSWNSALSLVEESHAFCMSSEVILAPHSIDMAYHMNEVNDNTMIVGRAEHCGQSYAYPSLSGEQLLCRTITYSGRPSGLGFVWFLPMNAYRAIGGYDEIYMNGYCYEDDDFVIRMWRGGSDFLFCDDIMGFHLEHKRDHLKNADGRVTINEKIFKDRFKDINLLKEWRFKHYVNRFDVGLTLISHEEDLELVRKYYSHQKFYGQDEPWRAIPVGPHKIFPTVVIK